MYRLSKAIQSWEAEGGASAPLAPMQRPALTGSVAQVHWAEEIRRRVDAEFDRVTATFTSIAERQSDAARRSDTYAIIAIVAAEAGRSSGTRASRLLHSLLAGDQRSGQANAFP